MDMIKWHRIPSWQKSPPISVATLNAAFPCASRALSPSPAARSYIIKYRSELFCHKCLKVVEHRDRLACTACGAEDLRHEQAGKSCGQCPIGVFEMTKLIVY